MHFVAYWGKSRHGRMGLKMTRMTLSDIMPGFAPTTNPLLLRCSAILT